MRLMGRRFGGRVSSVDRRDRRHTPDVGAPLGAAWKVLQRPSRGHRCREVGHRLAASVVLRPDSSMESQATRDYLNGKVLRFEEPSDALIVSSIPSKPADEALQKRIADVITSDR
jgi:hypothetical protein